MSIIEGGLAGHSVYRTEAQHLAAGEGPAVDMCNEAGVAWLAPFDGIIASGTGSDPFTPTGWHAGDVVVLQGKWRNRYLRVHFCHGQAMEVAQGQIVMAGDVIGHVGRTGTFLDNDGTKRPGQPGEEHLHLWAEEDDNGVWRRCGDVQGLLAEFEQEESMTPAQTEAVNILANNLSLPDGASYRLLEIRQLVQKLSSDLTSGDAVRVQACVTTLNDIDAAIGVLSDECGPALATLQGE